jgi:protein-S-isoprenylcysteine O-methyltransferase Ste14
VIGQFLLLGLIAVFGVLHIPAVRLGGPLEQVVLAVGIAELAIGAWAMFSAFRELGPNLTPLPRPSETSSLVRTGIYARIRHPIYAGLTLAGIGWATATRSLPAFAAAVVLCFFLDAKARREEAWLLDRYPDYAAYRTGSRRFLPRVY